MDGGVGGLEGPSGGSLQGMPSTVKLPEPLLSPTGPQTQWLPSQAPAFCFPSPPLPLPLLSPEW